MDILQFILVNIIIPLVITYIGMYFFPRIELFLKYRSLSSRQRKIEELMWQYEKRKRLNEFPHLIAPFAIMEFTIRFVAVIIALAGTHLYYSILENFFVNPASLTSPYTKALQESSFMITTAFGTFVFFIPLIRLLQDSLYFHRYRVKAEQKMIKLGGNPEDLDKIDKALEAG